VNADPTRIRLQRRAVRVLPVTPDRRVLLLQCVKPGAPDAPFWVTAGGGLEPGEDERAAAVRELWEETSICLDPATLVGPIHEEVIEFSWAEFDIVQQQSYYLAELDETPVSFEHLEEVEIPTTLGYRWWPVDELRTTAERILGNQLAVIHNALN
jgi:8-oxo-dGTP pyrophosphatase MutT (NUDIX family)